MAKEDRMSEEVPYAPEDLGHCRALTPDELGKTPCGNTHKTYTHCYKLCGGDTNSFAMHSPKNVMKPALTNLVPPNAPPLTKDPLHTMASDENNHPHGTPMYMCSSDTSL